MKYTELTMGIALVGALSLTGCPGGDDTGAGESTSETPSSTTTTDASTSGGAGSGSDTLSDTTGEPDPMPEFDCEGVSRVLDQNVIIESEDDLTMLAGVSEVTRSVQIDKTTLTNLDALGCITNIGGDLQIFGNDALDNVDGLVNLTEIGGSLIFTENQAITDFDGLQRLTKIAGSLSMNKNDAMTQISGFDSLVGIEDNVTIRDNGALTNIDGMKGLMVVGGVLGITANPMLCISSVNCVGDGITSPPTFPPEWSTNANDPDC